MLGLKCVTVNQIIYNDNHFMEMVIKEEEEQEKIEKNEEVWRQLTREIWMGIAVVGKEREQKEDYERPVSNLRRKINSYRI